MTDQEVSFLSAEASFATNDQPFTEKMLFIFKIVLI